MNKPIPSSPVLLIDASIFIFRYYFSLPDRWFSDEDWPTAAVYGYTQFLLNLIEQEQPSLIAACYDESLDSCFRNTIYPDYKSSRALPDEALAFQLAACKEVGELLGIASFASETYEADDLLGSLLSALNDDDQAIAVLTRDKDLGQLIERPQDFLWHPDFNATSDRRSQELYRDDIANKFGVQPEQLIDYLALVGDSIDDIPGVPGIGAKTAAAMLAPYKNMIDLFTHIDDLHTLPVRGAKNLADKLIEHTEQIALSRELATIVRDIPLIASRDDLRLQAPDFKALEKAYSRWGFSSAVIRCTEKVLAL